MTLQEYLQGLAKVVSDLVGDKLSVAKGSNPIPSVYIERQKPPKPFYPYSTTDYIGTGSYGVRELHRTFDDTTNSEVSYFNRRIRLRVAFYGVYGNNILDITDELANKLRTSKGRSLIAKYMPDASLNEVSTPSYNTSLLTTDYEEFSFITLDFWVISTISDSSFYYISETEVTGELKEQHTDEDYLILTAKAQLSD